MNGLLILLEFYMVIVSVEPLVVYIGTVQ